MNNWFPPKLLPWAKDYDSFWSTETQLTDSLTYLQLEVKALKLPQRGLLVQLKPVAFISTNVPRFSGISSWNQYRQVFDAIVRSNGWGDATATLQFLSHLEGDALNVALLVPKVQRATRVGLVGELTEHYGSPGRLADYRRQFERTTRQEGDDPSIFAVMLETLAAKAFGGMCHKVRLRLIRDWFVAGHENCSLRRHLDSVSPETPIRDIFDRCRVWESHADTGIRRVVRPVLERALLVYTVDELVGVLVDRVVVAVTAPPVDITEATASNRTGAIATTPADINWDMRLLLQSLLSGVLALMLTPPPQTGIVGMETLLQRLQPGAPVLVAQARPTPGPLAGSMMVYGLPVYDGVFSVL